MARKPVKRKSEATSHDFGNKSKKLAGPRGNEDTEMVLSGLANASDSASSRRELPSRKIDFTKGQRVDEYEDDPGRMENQQFLNLARMATANKRSSGKPNRYLKDFGIALNITTQQLVAMIKSEENELANHQNEFMESFRTAYLSVASNSTKPDQELLPFNRDESLHPLYQKCQQIIHAASNLTQQYHDMGYSIEQQRKETSDVIERIAKTEDLRRILANGKIVGEWKARQILGICNDEMIDPKPKEIDNRLFDSKLDDESSTTWASVAHRQKKAVRRFVRVLPTTQQ